MAGVRKKEDSEFDGRMVNAIREIIGLQPLYITKNKDGFEELTSYEKWAGTMETTFWKDAKTSYRKSKASSIKNS